jgi:hypothetical protein
MLKVYHRAITVQALSTGFDPSAMEAVIAANLGQDNVRGQIGHPEFHFDANAFAKSWAYMAGCRALIRSALEVGDALSAQWALGRLTHAGQDLYAHSNYVPLWLSRFPEGKQPPPEEIDPFDSDLLHGPALRSGKIYWPLEPLGWVAPFLKKFIVPLLPPDSHAWMNLDEPERGPLFPYAIAAAVKRTRCEYERAVQGLALEQVALLCGRETAHRL